MNDPAVCVSIQAHPAANGSYTAQSFVLIPSISLSSSASQVGEAAVGADDDDDGLKAAAAESLVYARAQGIVAESPVREDRTADTDKHGPH